MIIRQANYVFKTKLKLEGGEWVELREPTSAEFQKLSALQKNGEEDTEKIFNEMRKLFPVCVVDSSFENEDGTKASGEDIFKLLDQSSSTMLKLIPEWIQSLPFQSKK